jgi:hypothetical protein
MNISSDLFLFFPRELYRDTEAWALHQELAKIYRNQQTFYKLIRKYIAIISSRWLKYTLPTGTLHW